MSQVIYNQKSHVNIGLFLKLWGNGYLKLKNGFDVSCGSSVMEAMYVSCYAKIRTFLGF